MSTSLKALVVDDAPDFRMLLGSLFRQLGIEAMTARDGETALAMARDERPAIICLDLMLPTVSGLEVCARLRSEPETAEVPILMVSARPFPQDRADARRAGADAFLSKPVDRQEFATTVRSLLWRRSRAVHCA